jgi:tRNA pseudouridine38-40 synthase
MRLKVTVAYNGANFVGWQRQSKGRTVQKTIEDVISVILNQPTEIFAPAEQIQGYRHLGQVFHFDSDFNIRRRNGKKL